MGVYTDENGEKIFCIPISKTAEESILDEYFPYGMGLLLINLDNGETEVASIRRDDIEETRQDFVIQWQEQKEDWSLWDGRQPRLILPRDTNIYWSLKGYVVMEMPADLLPDQNEELYQRFPGLEAYKGQENKKVTFFFGGYPEPQEIAPLLEEE